MESEKRPSFQFYPADFLIDGNVAQMTLMERGAYITLICLCWQERSLPNTPDRLARMIGSTPAVFAKLWPALEPCFRLVAGRWVHPRLEKERRKQDDFRRQQAEKGRAGAAARWQDGDSRGHIPVMPPAMPVPLPNGSQTMTEGMTGPMAENGSSSSSSTSVRREKDLANLRSPSVVEQVIARNKDKYARRTGRDRFR